MDIIFHGQHDECDAVESFKGVLRLFHERYHIGQFREMHVSVTLVDEAGHDVELVDSETDETYRIFEVYRQEDAFCQQMSRPGLKLVIDNTKS